MSDIPRKWELAIACRDEEDLASGHKRKKEGDIIDFKPHPWNWGKKEVKGFLVVIVDGLTLAEVNAMKTPYIDGGLRRDDVETQEVEYNEAVKGTALAGVKFQRPETLAKRRFNIDLQTIKNGWCPDLDKDKVRDKDLEYQPLKKEVVIDFTEKVAICFDKYIGACKYAEKKVI